MHNSQPSPLAKLIGDPKQTLESLKDFQKSARIFSSKRLHQNPKYRGKWVATHQGRIIATINFERDMARKLENLKVNPSEVLFRHIELSETRWFF